MRGVRAPHVEPVREALGAEQPGQRRVEGSDCVGCTSQAPVPTQSWTNTVRRSHSR